eukprot:8214450-Alexandrium_andersonii.AAC.1
MQGNRSAPERPLALRHAGRTAFRRSELGLRAMVPEGGHRHERARPAGVRVLNCARTQGLQAFGARTARL